MTAPSLPGGHSPDALLADLRGLGVREGDVLMIHASLRKLGRVVGGAEAVIDTLDRAVGVGGTLLMVLGAVIEHEWVNEHPETDRALLLAGAQPYDPLTAPVLPEVGHLAEVFRTRPGTVVNDNPSGRFAARGHAARALLQDTPWDDYYGPGSPLHRLCEAGGRVLRLGANPDTTTVLHYAEYLSRVPGRRVRRHYLVQGATGPEVRSVECLDDEHGIVDWPGDPRIRWPENDYFAVILKEYLAAGRGTRGRVGGAEAELIPAAELVDFGAEWMTRNLALPPAKP